MSLEKEMNLQSPFSDVFHETVLNIMRTANMLSATGAMLFRRFGLTEAQFNVLFALKYNSHHVTQSDLGKKLVVTRATITSVLDKLEGKGLVERVDVPSNRRIYHIQLTEPGRALLEKVEPRYREKLHDAMQDLGEMECRATISFMERVRAQTAEVQEDLGTSGGNGASHMRGQARKAS